MNIPLPTKPKVKNKKDHSAVFEIEGLYPGYGITLGNSLRRVLLSSLEGAAITQAKIKGASHEFSTLDGVLEDVVVILLNLKKVRLKLFSDEPQTATLSVKGEKEVLAKDFKLSSEVEIANPDMHIASLTKSNAELNIEVKIEKGTGYQTSEARESDKSEVGMLPLDAIFTPMKMVSFKVENMRVGKKTDFDRLSIEIETDGTISPEDALKKSAALLIKHFTTVFDGIAGTEPKQIQKQENKPVKKTKKKESVKKAPAKKTVVKKAAKAKK